MLRAILWDNDGILVDSERIFFEVNRAYFERQDIELFEQDFFEWFLVQDCGAWHLLAEQGLSPSEIAQCRVDRNRLFTERLMAEESLLIPGVSEVWRNFAPTFVWEL